MREVFLGHQIWQPIMFQYADGGHVTPVYQREISVCVGARGLDWVCFYFAYLNRIWISSCVDTSVFFFLLYIKFLVTLKGSQRSVSKTWQQGEHESYYLAQRCEQQESTDFLKTSNALYGLLVFTVDQQDDWWYTQGPIVAVKLRCFLHGE